MAISEVRPDPGRVAVPGADALDRRRVIPGARGDRRSRAARRRRRALPGEGRAAGTGSSRPRRSARTASPHPRERENGRRLAPPAVRGRGRVRADPGGSEVRAARLVGEQGPDQERVAPCRRSVNGVSAFAFSRSGQGCRGPRLRRRRSASHRGCHRADRRAERRRAGSASGHVDGLLLGLVGRGRLVRVDGRDEQADACGLVGLLGARARTRRRGRAGRDLVEEGAQQLARGGILGCSGWGRASPPRTARRR